MKKIIYIIISLIALIGCAENTYILEPTLPLEDTEVETLLNTVLTLFLLLPDTLNVLMY